MHNVIAPHLENDAQPVPELWTLLPMARSHAYILNMVSYGIEYSLG